MVQSPTLVDKAKELADSMGFSNSCLDEVGALLYVLAGHVQSGNIAEIGTGCGVSTAWMASATSMDVYTVDVDPQRTNAVHDLFRHHPHVHPMVGDWETILHHGPFRLIFVDAKPAKLNGIEQIVQATEVGGLIVIDDLTPVEFWRDEWKGKPDVVRDTWLQHPQLDSIEIRTSLKASAILARRRA